MIDYLHDVRHLTQQVVGNTGRVTTAWTLAKQASDTDRPQATGLIHLGCEVAGLARIDSSKIFPGQELRNVNKYDANVKKSISL